MGHTAGRLSRLLDQLLSWALLQQGTMPHHPEKLPLAEVVEEVIELFGPAATTKGIKLDCRVPTSLHLWADPAGLRTILRNLISNAIKFTPKGGQVVISGITETDGRVSIKVVDDGIGMEANRLRNLLRGEGRTDRGTEGEKGSGLGLRLVRELVQLHSADISVESNPGAGSRFSLTFPV